MVDFGFYASLEQFSPSTCLAQTQTAEATGFESVWVNDHFHPWFHRTGDDAPAHGGDCWTWLAAAYERTDSITIGPGVTAILHRHHPANIAHNLGTLTDLYGDRVVFGIGTGIPINEVPLGYPWPPFTERASRTAEAIRLIRELFDADHVTHDGQYWSVEDAHLYTRGPRPPIHVSASGPTSTRLAGDLGDGFWTVPEDSPDSIQTNLFPHLDRGVQNSEHNDAVEDVEKTINILCSYAPDYDAAVRSCLPWRVLLLPETTDSVADPRDLQSRLEAIPIERMESAFLITSDPNAIIEDVAAYVDAGFDRVVFHSASPDQDAFCRMVHDEVMPAFD